MIIKYQSKQHTLYVNDNSVTMACNQTKMPHCLSNLSITFNDLPFYAKTQNMSDANKVQALKQLILKGDIDKLNKITGDTFKRL